MALENAVSRLSLLSQHIVGAEGEAGPDLQRQNSKAEEEVRPAPGGGKGTLTVIDNRTGKKYTVSYCWSSPLVAARCSVREVTSTRRPSVLRAMQRPILDFIYLYCSWRSLTVVPSQQLL